MLYHEIQPRVLVGILHTELTSMAWAFGLRNLILPPGSRIFPVAGRPYDHARNEICMTALDGGFDYAFHLDSDVIPPADAVLRLLRHRKPIISGIYHRRSPPHGIPVMLKGGQWMTSYPPNQVIEVDLVGAGCLLMSADLLRAMPPIQPNTGKHWFSWQSDLPKTPGNEGWQMSEDFVMNRFIREKMNIPVLVDTSIICRHAGMAEAQYGSMVPLNTVA